MEAPRRRRLLRVSAGIIISEEQDPDAHADPARRGGYLVLQPGRVPEIILDGLADPGEQQQAEERCLRQIDEARRSGTASTVTLDLPPESSASTRSGGLSRSSAPQGSSRSSISAPSHGSTPAGPRQATLLGQRLVALGLVTPADLREALEQQKALPPAQAVRRLGSLLCEGGKLSLHKLAESLGQQRGYQATSGAAVRLDTTLCGIFPRPVLQEIEAVPVCLVGKTVAVGMIDPQRREQVQRLQELTRLHVRPILAPQLQVHQMLLALR